MNLFHQLPSELYDNVISYIQPNKHIKNQYKYCLDFINDTSIFDNDVPMTDENGNRIRKGFLYSGEIGDVRKPEQTIECIVLVIYVGQKFSRHYGYTTWREKFFNYLIYQEPDLTHPLGRWSKDIKHIQGGIFMTLDRLKPLRKNSKIVIDNNLQYGDILSTITEIDNE